MKTLIINYRVVFMEILIKNVQALSRTKRTSSKGNVYTVITFRSLSGDIRDFLIPEDKVSKVHKDKTYDLIAELSFYGKNASVSIKDIQETYLDIPDDLDF